MALLTRADLLEFDEETLLATASCWGIEVESLTADEAFEQFADLLDGLAVMAAEID